MPMVAAAALPHTPQLLVRPATEDRDMVLRVHAGYGEIKRLLEAVKPEVICIVGGDHVEGFFLTAVPALAIYVGASVSGRFDRYHYTFDVHEPLARHILEASIERGFDLAYSQDLALDYAFYVPLHFAMPEPRLPIVPLYVNVYLPPQPTAARCYAWGRALRAILDARPERVALLTSGGLSHFPGSDRYDRPDYDWDGRMLDTLVQGRGIETATLTAEELDKAGNVEFRTWITLLGAVGDARARVVCYEPSWHHGNAIVTWPIGTLA
jgi:2,3-dihydroxyphenylpropionate 1,2-dioxygenase